jgi:hypothetical protein
MFGLMESLSQLIKQRFQLPHTPYIMVHQFLNELEHIGIKKIFLFLD